MLEKKIMQYQFASWGGHAKVLTNDEEELIVCAMEYAAKMCFPWSVTELIRLAWTMMKKLDPKHSCPTRSWVRGFEKRWRERLIKCKTSSIDPARASQANSYVRDAVFEKFTAFQADLVEQGEFTLEQMQNLADHICNVDEVGGDELGKRTKCYQAKKSTTTQNTENPPPLHWRNVEVGGDHNPFHATTVLGTIAKGIIVPAVSVVHSTPGYKSTRVRSDLLEGLPGLLLVNYNDLSELFVLVTFRFNNNNRQ